MNNWIDPSEIEIVQPQNPEAVDAIADDIEAMALLMPGTVPGFTQSMREFPEQFYIAYHLGKPVGYIEINDCTSFDYLGPDSLEFGGSVLPEYRDKGLTMQCAPWVIRDAFERTGKSKMLSWNDRENHEARMAITALGFKPFGPDPNPGPKLGKMRYILKRKDLEEI